MKASDRIELEHTPWIPSTPGTTCDAEEDGVCIANEADSDGFARSVLLGPANEGYYLVRFEGENVRGNAGLLYVVDEYNHVLGEATLQSTTLLKVPAAEEHALLVKVFPCSEIKVTCVSVRVEKAEGAVERFFSSVLKGKAVVVVPTYPTPENKYPCAFVHARVQAYLQARVPCDVVCAFDYEGYCAYEFEGVRVLRIPIGELPAALRLKRYRSIFLHFFDLRFARMLEESDLDDTPIFLWSHNPETRYWDWPEFTAPYFCDPPVLSEEQKQEFRNRDEVIRRFNEMPNVSWVFVSEPLKARSEELLGLSFNRAYVIPNLVDDEMFRYERKDPDLRRKVFLARKFDNVATYAIDIDVACIVELSKRPFFSDMEFDLYGTGGFYDQLVEPLRGFENVHLHRRFLTRSEIAEAHKDHGIALYATRFDSQGVSMGEAAMSGLAVVSSDIEVARAFLPNEQGLLCDVEDPTAYADAIERLYRDPERFVQAGRACYEKAYRLCRREETVNKEIKLAREACRGRTWRRVTEFFANRRNRSQG